MQDEVKTMEKRITALVEESSARLTISADICTVSAMRKCYLGLMGHLFDTPNTTMRTFILDLIDMEESIACDSLPMNQSLKHQMHTKQALKSQRHTCSMKRDDNMMNLPLSSAPEP
uniref:Uncharacterized protein n=1 Tax=Ditylenchus dipsaci TaxID=166011 RepID=A0A915DDW3_9BILA